MKTNVPAKPKVFVKSRVWKILALANLTSLNLAEKMDYNPQYVSMILRGACGASTNFRRKLLDILSVSFGDIFYFKREQKSQ